METEVMMSKRKISGRYGATHLEHRSRLSRIGENGNGAVESSSPERLSVLKTYKIFIAGKFPRTESGRYYLLKSAKGQAIANLCLCSRKDVRDAVAAARSAQGSWAGKSAFNRGQILYRIAEMLEGRSPQFVAELVQMGSTRPQAEAEVAAAVDRCLYYAGWADKYQQVFSSVNPVSSSHFNFSVLEPTGVVTMLAPDDSGLIGLVSVILPAIVGGNTAVALASTTKPLCAVTFAEVLATSDVPAGVVNILTGKRDELLDHLAGHMDVNATLYCGQDPHELAAIRIKSALNVKRVISYDREDWTDESAQSPYFILDMQEVKTTWHPVGV
jgi:acyl-CoA reductase-like NAD-dependent aldehyde dehydrogenase